MKMNCMVISKQFIFDIILVTSSGGEYLIVLKIGLKPTAGLRKIDIVFKISLEFR